METTTLDDLRARQIGDIAKALGLLTHMVRVLAEEDRPSFADIAQVEELIEQIQFPKPV